LGKQKFGSSPFSEHFDRWLTNVTIVLDEFESHPNIQVDEQFGFERTQALSTIKNQLENRRQKEGTLEKELKALSDCKNRLKEFNSEYLAKAKFIKTQKNRETKQFYTAIEQLKEEQDTIIKMKTGFFRGISQKEREQKEAEIIQQISHKQNQFETLMLDYNLQQKDLRADYENKRAPVVWQIKCLKENVANLEADGSLEERWLACDALADSVSTFMLRKKPKTS
jgi:DNA repair exonuclease SbcCD ATPase subunit